MMRLATAMAELLDVELLGLFLEDTSLRELARLPFAREFRPSNGGWHAIDVDRLSDDIERAARAIERMFSDMAKNAATRHQFEIIRGPVAVTLPSISRSGDIVMIVEPSSVAERSSQQFAWLIEAAFSSEAAVMIVPPRIARSDGPVLAIAAGPDDPSIDAAAAVAGAAKEELVIIDLAKNRIDDNIIQKRIAAPGYKIRHVVFGPSARFDPHVLDGLLQQFQERMIVLTRGIFDDRRAAGIASIRNVPVLIVEPAGLSGSQ
jgi:hypothetical protein